MAWMPVHQRPARSRTGRRSASAQARWGCEALEPRVLLTTAEFMVHLYRDEQGSPGARITDDTVEVGASFFVEITAREYDPDFTGLAAVALDIAWDPTTIREIDANFDPSDPTSSLVTSDLPLYRHGWLDNEAGTIEDLAGLAFSFSGVGRALGDVQPDRFSLLHFQAIQPAESSPFSIQQGRAGIVTAPVSSLGRRQIYFEPQTITVKATVPASAVAETAVPAQLVCHPEHPGAVDGEADGEAPEAMASTRADDDVATPLADFAPLMSSDSDGDDNLAVANSPVPPSTHAAETRSSSGFEGTTFQPLAMAPGFGPPHGLASATAKVAETPPSDWLCKTAARSLAAYTSNVDDLLGRSDFDLSAL